MGVGYEILIWGLPIKVGVDFLIGGCRLNEKLAIYYSRFANLFPTYSLKGILENGNYSLSTIPLPPASNNNTDLNLKFH